MTDTIVSLSSGAPPAGIAVIRASGPRAPVLARLLAGDLPTPRRAAFRILVDRDGREIDRGLVLWFPAPASFTGEDCVEFQLHGGRAVVDRLIAVATAIDGVRLAEAGEFTRRAFSHGKLDLIEAEALGDLIAAETEAQRRFAVAQACGAQSRLYAGWRERLLHGRAMVEAEIDFADEEDVPGSVSDRIWEDMEDLTVEIDAHIAGEARGRIMRSGFQVTLVGAPNAGKSTLLNALSGHERAIVSDVPGTTRDIVEARLDLGGYLVVLADTAGLRARAGAVEQEGMRRAVRRAEQSDLVIHLDEHGVFADLNLDTDRTVWRVRSKGDLAAVDGRAREADFVISAATGAGLDRLAAALKAEVNRRGGDADALAPGRDRHMGHLRACKAHLIDSLSERRPLEVRAEALRLAADDLGRITGRIDVEDMLGAIFSKFCVGK